LTSPFSLCIILSINTSHFMVISDLANPGLYQNTGQSESFIATINWGTCVWDHLSTVAAL
jgi:hypothetical protein